MRDRIEINKDLIPYTFEILLGGVVFTIGVNYNSYCDLFTFSLYKNGELICAGEPLIYGVPLWKDVYIADEYPAVDIIPIDESGENDAVTYDNLGRTVFLVIDNQEESL